MVFFGGIGIFFVGEELWNLKGVLGDVFKLGYGDGIDVVKSIVVSNSVWLGSSGFGVEWLGVKFEEEMELDIFFVCKCREVND